jgi:hypothetical protein
MLCVIMLIFIIPSVVMLSVVLLIVILLSVVMVSAVAPQISFLKTKLKRKRFIRNQPKANVIKLFSPQIYANFCVTCVIRDIPQYWSLLREVLYDWFDSIKRFPHTSCMLHV